MRRVATAILILCASMQATAAEIMVWDKKPLKVQVEVGKERIIAFPDHVYVGVPSALKQYARIQSMQGAVYVRPEIEFPPARIQVKLASTGEIVLIDLEATTEPVASEDIIVSMAAKERKAQAESVVAEAARSPVAQSINPRELTRYAAMRFYAPERFHTEDRRISRAHVRRDLPLDSLFMGPSYGLFSATAVAAWQANGMVLTAVKLVNNSPVVQPINCSHINADFLYATPQHMTVNPAGEPGDITMLYLITERPLSSALYIRPTAGDAP